MYLYFFLAICLGLVLRLLAHLGIRYVLNRATSDSDMRAMPVFHVSCISYVMGTILKYAGGTLLFAYFIKTFF